MDTVEGDAEEGAGDAALSTAIVDHNPAACRLCLSRKPPAGGGGGSTGTDMVTGMLFPPASSPLWARLGAADASAHGSAALAVDNNNGSKEGGGSGGDSGSPFFPAKSPGTEKTSTSSHSSVSAKSGGDGGGGDGSGHSTGAPSSAPAAPPTAAGSNLFKGAAMFGRMKMNMGGIFNKGAAGSNQGETAPAAAPAAEKTEGVSSADAAGPSDAGRGDTAGDLAAKLRLSFGRFGGSKDAKKGGGEEGGSGGAATAAAAEAAEAVGAGSTEKEKDSALGSLFRKVGFVRRQELGVWK